MIHPKMTVVCDRGETTRGRECCASAEIGMHYYGAVGWFREAGWRTYDNGENILWICPSCARAADRSAMATKEGA